MKKILAIAMAACLLVSTFTGCGKKNNPVSDSTTPNTNGTSGTPAYLNTAEFPIVKDKIVLKVMGSKTAGQGPWEEMDVIKRMEKITNVSFEFDTPISTSYLEKKNLAFASGEYPDVFMGSALNIDDEEIYGPQGVLLPLEDLINKYAPHLKKFMSDRADVKKAITASDGHIYALPYVVSTKTTAAGILYINMTWLQNVGLQKPTNVDDLYTVMKAFKEKDANKNGTADEIPISAVKLNVPNVTILNAFTGTAGGAGFDLKGDKVVYTPMESGYKEYLTYMHKLYSEGLIDNELFTQQAAQMSAKGKANKVGILTSSPSGMLNIAKYDPHEVLPPLTSSISTKKVTQSLPGINTSTFALTKKCKYPEAMLRWVDLLYRDDNEAVEGISGMSMFLGIYGDHWEYTDSAKTKYKRVAKDSSISVVENTSKTYTPGAASGFPSKVITNAVPDGDPFLLLKATESDKHYFPYMIPIYPSTVRLAKAETERSTFLTKDITDYLDQMNAKFIVGEESLDKFDNFISTLKKMNIEELLKIKQAGYDRWNKTK